MNLSDPAAVLLSSGDAKALAVLTRTTRPLSGREVARLAGASPATIWRALTRLVEHGLVNVQEAGAGAALLYVLNREHLAAQAVVTLLSLRSQLVDRLMAEFAEWRMPPVHASLFGSAARGDGDTSSDVDLLVVRPDCVPNDTQWADQFERLSADVLAWTGNRAGIAEVSKIDIAAMVADARPIVDELLRDGVWLYGLSVHEMLTNVGR